MPLSMSASPCWYFFWLTSSAPRLTQPVAQVAIVGLGAGTLASYARVLAVDPNAAQAHANRGNVLHWHGRNS